jgi:hypothetical protein
VFEGFSSIFQSGETVILVQIIFPDLVIYRFSIAYSLIVPCFSNWIDLRLSRRRLRIESLFCNSCLNILIICNIFSLIPENSHQRNLYSLYPQQLGQRFEFYFALIRFAACFDQSCNYFGFFFNIIVTKRLIMLTNRKWYYVHINSFDV